jgi:hypothetical protein
MLGAKSVVIAAPAFPTPNIPNALPCQLFGNQTDVFAIPAAKAVPAIPNPKPVIAKSQKSFAKDVKYMGIALNSNMPNNILFPPYLSVSIPMGNRKIDPESIGKPISHPISDGLQLKIPLSTR